MTEIGDDNDDEDLGSVASGKGSEYSKLDSCHESFVDEDHEGSDISSDSSDETKTGVVPDSSSDISKHVASSNVSEDSETKGEGSKAD